MVPPRNRTLKQAFRSATLVAAMLYGVSAGAMTDSYATDFEADAPPASSVDAAFAAALARARPGSSPDAAVSAACAKVLSQGTAAEYEDFRFALWREGSIDAIFLPWTARFESEARAREAAPEAIGQLVSVLFNRWGVASETDENGRVTVAVIVVERRLGLAPTPRMLAPGDQVSLSLSGISTETARVVVSAPGGDTTSHDLAVSSRRGAIDIALTSGVGRYDVEVVIPESTGPLIVASFPLVVGMRFPEKYTPPVFAAEAGILPEARSAANLIALINASRKRYGLPPIAEDATLAPVAKKASASQIGQAASPLPQRLDAARAFFLGADELSGMGSSSAAIHAAWMASPTHRLVLLDNRVTHIGAGVSTIARRDKSKTLQATAIVAELVPRVDPARGAVSLLATVNARRAKAGAKPLRADPALAAAASRHAAAMAAADLADYELPSGASVFEAAKKAAPGASAIGATVGVWTALGDAAEDETLADPLMERAGIGIVQRSSAANGRGALWIVILVAR